MCPPPPRPRLFPTHLRSGGGLGVGGERRAEKLPDSGLCPIVLGTVSAHACRAPATLWTPKPPHHPTNETEWLSSIRSDSRWRNTCPEPGTGRSEPPSPPPESGGQAGGRATSRDSCGSQAPRSLFRPQRPDDAGLGTLRPRVLVCETGVISVCISGGCESR